MKTKIISSQTADSKPVKQEVNGTVILPRLVFPDLVHVKTHAVHVKTHAVHVKTHAVHVFSLRSLSVYQ